MATSPLHTRRTKIIATVGPASRSPDMLRRLIAAGVNVFRLNFSHGSHEEHTENLHNIRAASKELGIPVGVLQDLSGPKVRITSIEGNYASIPDLADVELRYAGTDKDHKPLTDARTIYVETINPAQVVKAGQKMLLADGLMEFKAVEVLPDAVRCKVIKGGRLRSRVGIGFPESDVNLPATTEKDMVDFQWGLKNNVDFVAISFVQNAMDMHKLRVAMYNSNTHVKLIAKIERKCALNSTEEILHASDGLLVARGDLGIEMPLEKVPLLQRQLIARANHHGIPAIVATQMLQSMVTSLRPTRAEATDVAFAVFNGADAVMLSEETTIGEHPVECVEWLSRIAVEAERSMLDTDHRLKVKEIDELPVADAVSYAVCAAAMKVNAGAIIACTASGNSARLVAKYRPHQPIFGVSSADETLNGMCLIWGVQPLKVNTASTVDDETERALVAVQKAGNFAEGTIAVVTVGKSFRTPGSTNKLEIREMKQRALP